jgi:hypothetical protein
MTVAENAKPAHSEESEDQSVLGLQDLETETDGPEVEAHMSATSIVACDTGAD